MEQDNILHQAAQLAYGAIMYDRAGYYDQAFNQYIKSLELIDQAYHSFVDNPDRIREIKLRYNEYLSRAEILKRLRIGRYSSSGTPNIVPHAPAPSAPPLPPLPPPSSLSSNYSFRTSLTSTNISRERNELRSLVNDFSLIQSNKKRGCQPRPHNNRVFTLFGALRSAVEHDELRQYSQALHYYTVGIENMCRFRFEEDPDICKFFLRRYTFFIERAEYLKTLIISCGICMEDITHLNNNVKCSNNHYSCNDCFNEYIINKCNEDQQSIRARDGNIYCFGRCEGEDKTTVACPFEFTIKMIGTHGSHDANEHYKRNIARVGEWKGADEQIKYQKGQEENKATDDLIKKTTKSCPTCGFGITHFRGHGCHHIRGCPQCGTHFCYVCTGAYRRCGCPFQGGTSCGQISGEDCGCPPCPTCTVGNPCNDCDDCRTCPSCYPPL